ncbi:DUF4398 domain-containing protein [Diaphorobacter sp. HDW4A]|uniref:DUF4398 domain-containing protein n=1 Tax=Diaphorobacter sp. HDW4A TaxID=2714924 RepID=UPI0014084520|nr:DUF4398 domain-containing protein [Diaphorobacter sp. HDW4A]QIL83092.1 DUF4398 domain-containing protein [Diaphorobacter sp. HDW4A]
MQSKLIGTALATVALAALTACSSIPAPQGEMAVAQSTVERVSTAPQVTAYAPVELQNARDLWSKAQRAMESKDYTEARRYAEAAEAQARLAETKAQVAENQARLQAVQRGYQTQPAR